MRTYLNNGVLIAVSNALVTLALYLGGFQTDPAKFSTGSTLSLLFSVVLTVVIMVRGVRSRRILTPPTIAFPFGLAMGIAVTIALFASVFFAVFQFIYLSFINTDFTRLVIETKLSAMQASGTTAAELETARQSMNLSQKPAVFVGMEFLLGMILNVLLSLVIAAFMQRKPTEEANPTSSAA